MAGKILILGGGFGGVRAALDLERYLGDRAEITLIDRNGYHLFIPAIYEVASARVMRPDIFASELRSTVAIPYAEIFHDRHINFIQAEIQTIDLEGKQVTTSAGTLLDFDYAVLAMGSETADFGIPGVGEYACQFRTVQDALQIHQKIEEFFEKQDNLHRPIRIAIIGAGFSGVELAAEIATYTRRHKQRLESDQLARVYLFEATPTILGMIEKEEREIIRRRLTRLGVIIKENSTIESVHSGTVALKTGERFDCDLVVWTAGIQAIKFLRSVAGLQLTEYGKIIVSEHLHLPNHENIFAIGDNIEFIDRQTQKPTPSLAYLAIQQGQIAARNIANHIEGKEMLAHKPFYGTWIAPVGRRYAIANLGRGRVFKGFLGWIVRELVDLRYFLSILPLGRALKVFFRDLWIFSRND